MSRVTPILSFPDTDPDLIEAVVEDIEDGPQPFTTFSILRRLNPQRIDRGRGQDITYSLVSRVVRELRTFGLVVPAHPDFFPNVGIYKRCDR